MFRAASANSRSDSTHKSSQGCLRRDAVASFSSDEKKEIKIQDEVAITSLGLTDRPFHWNTMSLSDPRTHTDSK